MLVISSLRRTPTIQRKDTVGIVVNAINLGREDTVKIGEPMPTDSNPTCACGDVYDEHENGGPCQAEMLSERGDGKYEPCPCVMFEREEKVIDMPYSGSIEHKE